MPPEVVTVFTQTINKYGTSLTFHWIILALSGLSEGYQCPCGYFIARLNKIWTIYSHFNGLQPYNTTFLEPNKSFDGPPLLDAYARKQALHTLLCCCWCRCPSRSRIYMRGMRELEGWCGTRDGLDTRDTGPGVAHCRLFIHTFLLLPGRGEGAVTGWHSGAGIREAWSNNELSANNRLKSFSRIIILG